MTVDAHAAEIANLKGQLKQLRHDFNDRTLATSDIRLELERRLTQLEMKILQLEEQTKKNGKGLPPLPLMHIFYLSVAVYILFGREPAIQLLMGLFK